MSNPHHARRIQASRGKGQQGQRNFNRALVVVRSLSTVSYCHFRSKQPTGSDIHDTRHDIKDVTFGSLLTYQSWFRFSKGSPYLPLKILTRLSGTFSQNYENRPSPQPTVECYTAKVQAYISPCQQAVEMCFSFLNFSDQLLLQS